MRIDSSTSSIPATFPFHVAQAYGVTPKAQVSRVSAPNAAGQAAPAGNVQATQPTPSSDLSASGKRLIAAVVPGRVDFSGDQPTQTSSLAMYRHPADKNAAATAVNVGRSLDVAG
jgi:hypothetical protein